MTDTDPDVLLRGAQAALQARDFPKARALLEEALRQSPDDLRLLDFAGFACFFAGDFVACEAHCRHALSFAPEHAYAWKGLGLALARQGRVDDGQQALERAIALQPRWFDPYWDLAVVLREAGRNGAAIDVLARGAASVPERAAELDRLRDLIARGR